MLNPRPLSPFLRTTSSTKDDHIAPQFMFSRLLDRTFSAPGAGASEPETLELGRFEVEVEVDPSRELRSRLTDWDGVVQATRLTSDLALTRSSSGGRSAVRRLWRLPLKIF